MFASGDAYDLVPAVSRIAAVVPVYCAETGLSDLNAELVAALAQVSSDYHVLYVDDGSPDASWERIQTIAASDPHVGGLRLIRNFGEHVAISAGLDHVDGDYVVIIACDGQDDPAAIPDMVRLAEQGSDLVLVRRIRRRDPIMKRVLARLFYAIIALLVHVRYDYRVGNYRLLSRRAVEYFRTYRERSRNVSAIMAFMDVRTAFLDVAHRPRKHGRSSYSFGRSLKMAADVVLDYSQIPLVFSAAVGVLLLVGTCLAAIVALVTQWDPLTSPTTVLVLAMGFVGGLVLLNLGIVGAYLGRAATEARGRPLYFLESAVGPMVKRK
jgi:glycosyltransferase involved in cell wall biosynthesis